MNYEKIYYSLITRAKNRIIDGYTESHHIIPRCLNGTDDLDNLVDLTPEEHYTAHLLLVKIYPDNDKLIRAAQMMIPKRPSNKMYGWLRRQFAEAQSRGQSGEGNSQFGTKWIFNRNLMISKKIPVNELVPTDWELGRISNWDKKIEYDSCPVCSKSKNSIRKFCSLSCSATHNNTTKKTIFDEYLDDIINDYINGMSIYQCLVSRKLCGTGANHTKLSKILKNRGLV